MDLQGKYQDKWNDLDAYLRNNAPHERDYLVIINHLIGLIANLNDRLIKIGK